MEIGAIGYNYSHGTDFVMDTPNGPGCWLLLLIKTKALFEINYIEINVRENSFIIISPHTPCKYRAAIDSYTDDWMYFNIEENDKNEFDKLKIPTDTPMHLGNVEELSQIMHIMTYEHYSADFFRSEIERHYFEIFLLKLSRIIHSKSYISSDSFIEKNHKLTQLRTRIFTLPDSIPDIDGMADEVGMSRYGFQHIYKKMFGVSVMTDVINGRIEVAKKLLSSTNLTIKEISGSAGYTNEYSFMRQFKSIVGKTPTEYRRCI